MWSVRRRRGPTSLEDESDGAGGSSQGAALRHDTGAGAEAVPSKDVGSLCFAFITELANTPHLASSKESSDYEQ